MIPLLKEGDIVEVLGIANISQLKRFDLVLYEFQDNYICHYYWDRNRQGTDEVLTRPLNPSATFDIPVRSQQIIGIIKNKKINLLMKIKIFLNDLL